MDKRSLYEKASALPFTPGVYIMKNSSGKVIYVGKSKVLRQRVSQYFADVEHNIKTEKMISQVCDFEYVLTDTEMEALALENKLIKLHKPKYNIRLKDSKSYPYIKMDYSLEYPVITVDRKRSADGCKYFGPYSSMSTAYAILKTAQKTYKIPNCKRVFPRDIGKDRPCIYKQLGQCVAPCDSSISAEDYKKIYGEIIPFLNGHYSDIKKKMEEDMELFSSKLQFENAALMRDRIRSIERLVEKQKAVSSPKDNMDVFSLYVDARCSCLDVFYIRDGFVSDSDFFIFTSEQIVDAESITDFICGIYEKREYVPKEIFFDETLSNIEIDTIQSLLSQKSESAHKLLFPQKGKNKELCNMVFENAQLHAKQYILDIEKDNQILFKLSSILNLSVIPDRIEAYDISNMGSDSIVAGEIVISNGKFNKNEYRTYNIKSIEKQDDYASMEEALIRRLYHTENEYPDLILLDGGKGHVARIRALLAEMRIDIPVFGMVKDDYHKTRALTTDTEEISIARDQYVFNFIYGIQEEVHRFTIGKMSNKRNSKTKKSSLENISGIGHEKAKILLSSFGSLKNIKEASFEKISSIKGISKTDAKNIIEYFKTKK